MTIDHAPTIRAFVEERLNQLRARTSYYEGKENVIEELENVLTLIDGLNKQNELLTKALGI
jgi:hypothetical protein